MQTAVLSLALLAVFALIQPTRSNADEQRNLEDIAQNTDNVEHLVKVLAEAIRRRQSFDWELPGTFGLVVDAGFPDGAGLDLSLEQGKWLRAEAGLTFNTLAPGLRGGLTIAVPARFRVRPTASLLFGRALEGDANWIGRRLTDNPALDNVSLRRVSYDYVNGQLGLEFSVNRKTRIYFQGGLSYVHSTIHDFQSNLENSAVDESNIDITAQDPTLNLLLPSGKLGVIVYWGLKCPNN